MNEYVIKIDRIKETVLVNNENEVELNGELHKVEYSRISKHLYLLKINNKTYEVMCEKLNEHGYRFLINGNYIETTVNTRLQEKANEYLEKVAHTHHDIVKAPMPGLILKLNKKAGDTVKLGEPLLVLEAMKMENEIRSPASGKISALNYKEGDSVEKDSIIFMIV